MEQNQDFLHMSGNAFRFNNHKCECKIGKDIGSDGNEHEYLMVRSTDNLLRFAYRPESGIILINKKGSVAAEHILNTLLAIKINDIKALQSFIETYGFFIPVSSSSFERFEWNDVSGILRRLKIAVELLSKVQSDPSDSRIILGATLRLLFMKQVAIRPLAGYQFESPKHQVTKLIETVVWGSEDESRLEKFDSNDAKIHKYRIPDTITASPFELSYFDYQDAINSNQTFNFREVAWNYKNRLDLPHEQRLIIDFLFHFQNDVAKIIALSENSITYSQKNFDIPATLTSALHHVAKQVLKDEFECAMGAISPIYDIESMSGTWCIPDLISGLYFSLFYMKSKFSILRKCANPNCFQPYFEVNTTNSRKIYCCIDCANAVAQRNFRLKKKQKLQ